MKYLCLVFFSIQTWLTATPVTHTLLAEKYLASIDHNYSDDDITAFFQGVLYPDIYYLALLGVTKGETHFQEITLEDVWNEDSPFKAGHKLHCFIDEQREEYVAATGVLDVFTNIEEQNVDLYLQIIEDEQYFEMIDLKAIKDGVYYIHPSEDFGQVPYHGLKAWHRFLGQYFSMLPVSCPSNAASIQLWAFCSNERRDRCLELFHVWVHRDARDPRISCKGSPNILTRSMLIAQVKPKH